MKDIICSNPRQNYYCFIAFGIDFKDLKLCNQIKETQNRNWCILGVAIANKKVNLCSSLNGSFYGVNIKDVCYMEVAKATKNIKICNMIDSFQLECNYTVEGKYF